MCVGDSIREGRNPPFGLPFIRIGAPDLGIPVRAHDGYDDVCVFRNGNLRDLTSIHSNNGFGKWEYGIFASAEKIDLLCYS